MKNDRLRSTMWRPVDDDTKAEHQRNIADELRTAAVPQRATHLTIRTALMATTLGAVLMGSAALAAEGSLPGDVLYPVKQVTESVRSVFDDEVVAEHRVEELDDLVRRDRPTIEIDEQLVEAQVEVDRLPSDSPLRDELAGLRHDIAALRDIPETDLPPARDRVPTSTTVVRDVPTTEPKTTSPTEPPPTTAPTETRPSDPPPTEPPPTTRAPSDEAPPTTQPPRDG